MAKTTYLSRFGDGSSNQLVSFTFMLLHPGLFCPSFLCLSFVLLPPVSTVGTAANLFYPCLVNHLFFVCRFARFSSVVLIQESLDLPIKTLLIQNNDPSACLLHTFYKPH